MDDDISRLFLKIRSRVSAVISCLAFIRVRAAGERHNSLLTTLLFHLANFRCADVHWFPYFHLFTQADCIVSVVWAERVCHALPPCDVMWWARVSAASKHDCWWLVMRMWHCRGQDADQGHLAAHGGGAHGAGGPPGHPLAAGRGHAPGQGVRGPEQRVHAVQGGDAGPQVQPTIFNITFHFNTIPFLHFEAVNFASAVCHTFSCDVYDTIDNTRHALIFSCQLNIFSFTAF